MSTLRTPHTSKDSRLTVSAEVCGGAIRVRGTRIAVWGIEAAHRLGLSTDRIIEMYPSLTKPDVEAALDYAKNHQGEMDDEIAAHQEP